MTFEKKLDLKNLILELFEQKKEVNVHEVARAAEMLMRNRAHQRTIQRAFKSLVESKTIEAHGNARSRFYTLLKPKQGTPLEGESIVKSFKDIPLSQEAENLLNYVSQPFQARTPIAYNQKFLRLYRPNRNFYLTETQRSELLNSGQSENKLRPPGTYARNILSRLLIDLSWNSSRLEGNTYSLLETKRLIELGESARGKNASETQMILNHKAAIEYIIESVAEEKITFQEICNVHALLSENLLDHPNASGRIRQIAVGIGGSTYMPLENPHVLKECFELFIAKLNLIQNPFEQSFFSLIHLSYLQAFEDVNKRTARIVANIPLIKKNLKPLSFTDINQEAYINSFLGVYEKNDISLIRDLYIWAYKQSSRKYSGVQQAMGESNLLKLKYRNAIQDIIRTIILEKVAGREVVRKIQTLMKVQNFPEADIPELFKLIEIEILSLYDGNIARFKIRPSEFQAWQILQ